MSTLYQYGRFTVNDALQTRAALLGYSVGLLALILVKILAPGFYARQVMGTPVKIAFVTVLVTQTLAVLLAWPLGLGQAGLTLATSIGACSTPGCCSGCCCAAGYYRRAPGWPLFLAQALRRLVVLAVVAGVARWASASTWLTAGVAQKLSRLALVIAAGAVAISATLFALGFRVARFQSPRGDNSAAT